MTDDDIAAALADVETALDDFREAMERLEEAEVTAVEVGDSRSAVRVGHLYDIDVTVTFDHTKRTEDEAIDALRDERSSYGLSGGRGD